MKKKFITLTLLVVSALFVTSCESVFDYDDDGRIGTDDIFSDPDLTARFLNNCYFNTPKYGATSAGGTFLACFTDEAVDVNAVEGNNAFKYYTGQMSSTNNPVNTNFYALMYESLQNCNIFLANIDNKEIVFATPELRSQFKAQAYLLRAYYYWNLIKRYGPMPYFDKELPMGYDYSQVVKPATFQECVEHVLDDCDAAMAVEDGLTWKNTIPGYEGTVGKGLVYALRSQATLFAASPLWNPDNVKSLWETAAEESANAIKELEAQGFKLYNPAKKEFAVTFSNNAYQDMFLLPLEYGSAPRNCESIYTIQSNVDSWAKFGLPSQISQGVTGAGMSLSQELVDAYETIDGLSVLDLANPYADDAHLTPNYNQANTTYDPANPYANRDPRLTATILVNGSKLKESDPKSVPVQAYVGGADGIDQASVYNTRTGYYLRKFVNPTSTKNSVVSGYWHQFRLAETYLNYAEAELEANGAPTAEAYKYVNLVRARVGMPPFPEGMDYDAFKLKLQNERRVELALEDHRYYDLRRWKINQNFETTVTGMEITKVGDVLTYKRIPVTVGGKRLVDNEKYRLWPLPIAEEQKFDLVGVDMQNPGW